MGYYIQTGTNKGKASRIVAMLDGKIVDESGARAALDAGKGVICVVDNGLFEAAGFAYDLKEFEAFAIPDGRPKTWIVCDRRDVEIASGYTKRGD